MNKVKLKDVAEIISGQSPSSSSYNKEGKGLPFFQGKTDFDVKYPQIKNWCTSPLKIAYPNDILISVRAPVGPVNICKTESCIGRGLSAIRAKKRSYYEFVYYYLKESESQIARLGVGSTFPAITQKDLSAIEIPLFPIETQIRIAKALSWVEDLINDRKKTVDLLDNLLKSKFQEMFGDPIKNEKGWQIKNIEQLVKKEKNAIKRGPFGSTLKKDFFQNEGHLVYEQYHALNNDFSFKRYYINNEKYNELNEFKVSPYDIIISCSGVYLGKLAIIPQDAKSGIINQALLKISLDQEVCSNEFFCNLFTHTNFKNTFLKNRGSGIPNFPPMSEFKRFKFINPPIELQNQFAKIVEKVEAIKKNYKESLLELENLYGSLSQRSFKGMLNLSQLDITEELDRFKATLPPQEVTAITKPPKIQQKNIKEEDKEDKNLTASIIHAALDWPPKENTFNSERIADLIRKNYKGYHFSFEMAYRFLKKQIDNTDSYYFTSEELLKDPKLGGEQDLKKFFYSAINDENPFIKLEQHFYDSKKENFDLKLTKEDYEHLQTADKNDRSGIYFSIEKS